jgi:MFS family permease
MARSMSSPVPNPLRRIALPAFGPSLLFGIGEGAILPIVPLTARDLGASVPVAALMVALAGIGSLVSNLPASVLTLRFGERWAIVAAALWAALAMVLCAWTGQLGVFALACFMLGMSQAVFNLARQSYLSEAVPIEWRARALSTLGGVMRIGLFIGPFLSAAVVHRWGVSGGYGVAVVALLVAAAVGARLPELEAPHSRPVPGAGLSFATTLREHRHVFLTLGLGVMLVAAVRASRSAVIPLWADHLGLSASVASLIYGLAGGIDMLLFYPAGRVMDLKGRRWVAVPSMLIMGAALLLMPFTHGPWTLLVAAMAIGFGNGIGSGLIMTLGADHSPPGERARFLGVWRLMADLGSTCGPALLSFLAAALSLGVAVASTGLLALAAAGVLGHWIPRVGKR